MDGRNQTVIHDSESCLAQWINTWITRNKCYNGPYMLMHILVEVRALEWMDQN